MDRDEVVDAKKFLSDVGAWPRIPEEANPDRWLDGFSPDHLAHAVSLMDALVFVDGRQVKKMFESAIHAISEEVTTHLESYAEKRDCWIDFLDALVLSAPTGEVPSTADSGYAFHRLGRKTFRLAEEQLVQPSLLADALHHATPSAVLFVDDFAGSGDQFLKTMNRNEWAGAPSTPGELLSGSGVATYYAPLVATSVAVTRIERELPWVNLRPVHVLDPSYSATDSGSILFPEHLRADAVSFIRDASAAAGITQDVYGYDSLALAIAFADSVPDATLPIVHSEEGGWFPLMPRT